MQQHKDWGGVFECGDQWREQEAGASGIWHGTPPEPFCYCGVGVNMYPEDPEDNSRARRRRRTFDRSSQHCIGTSKLLLHTLYRPCL